MKKRRFGLVFGAVVIALLMVSSATAVSVVQSNRMKGYLESKSSDIEIDLQTYSEKLLNSPYGIDVHRMKMNEVKQLVYKEVFKMRNLLLKFVLLSRANKLFRILYEIGINDGTTIAQASDIITQNKDVVISSAEGMNLLCSVSIDCGFGGRVGHFPPPSQLIRPNVLVRWWAFGSIPAPAGHVHIDGLLGVQEDMNLYKSGNNYKGALVGYMGMIISGFLNAIAPSIGGFALFSICRKIG